MPDKEATARIKINTLLEAAGWRLFADDNGPANITEIEAEQELVAANRELIARMEKKIQATLAHVWGEPASTDALLEANEFSCWGTHGSEHDQTTHT